RFMFMNVDRVGADASSALSSTRPSDGTRETGLRPGDGRGVRPCAGIAGFNTQALEDRWILSRFNRVAADVTDALATYRFHEAANRIYDFFWGEFCDWYLELIKPRLNSEDANTSAAACSNLVSLFEASLRLLHPVMPFITEEI